MASLVTKTESWEEERNKVFLYDGVSNLFACELWLILVIHIFVGMYGELCSSNVKEALVTCKSNKQMHALLSRYPCWQCWKSITYRGRRWKRKSKDKGLVHPTLYRQRFFFIFSILNVCFLFSAMLIFLLALKKELPHSKMNFIFLTYCVMSWLLQHRKRRSQAM